MFTINDMQSFKMGIFFGGLIGFVVHAALIGFPFIN